MGHDNLVLTARSTADGPWEVVLDPGSRDDWSHTGLRVAALDAGASADWASGDLEAMIVPLNGGCAVTVGDGGGGAGTYDLGGRRDVFAGPTDVLYVGRGTTLSITSAEGGRFAFATAVAGSAKPTRFVAADSIPVEVRGAGNMTRKVRNFGTVGVFDDADSLIACEVITPGGNWSSYPAHKHDETTETESELEEIYYYEVAASPEGAAGFGFHETTGATDERPLQILTRVGTGDVVLVPHGWHGPCAAAPGHDMYYLNVMAGPAEERAWKITDHPDQTWLRGTWVGLEPDPRAQTS